MNIRRMALLDVIAVKRLIDSSFSKNIKMQSLLNVLESDNDYMLILEKNKKILAVVGIRDKNRICWLCSAEKRKGHAKKYCNTSCKKSLFPICM